MKVATANFKDLNMVKKALELLKEHKVTIRKAAKLANVSYLEMVDLASKVDIKIKYSLSELRKDIV